MSAVSPEIITHEVSINNNNIKLKLSSRRWLVLFIFALISFMNAFHWIEHNIIQDVIISYYNSSLPDSTIGQNESVNWLSLVYMLCYIPLVFPAMFLLDMKGLKLTVGIGALLTAVGAWIKCGAVNPNRFAVLMFAQTICAVAQVFTLGVPARLSAVWFGSSEISTATSIGVFGNQLGTAVGFLLPPFIIPPNLSIEEMTRRFYYFYFSVAGICTFLFILSIMSILITLLLNICLKIKFLSFKRQTRHAGKFRPSCK
jgi:FLVCR family feline leukemia virus subgroup C receptor-related protein